MMHKVNTFMEEKQTQSAQQDTQQKTAKPNENAGFAVMGHVKIFDPNSKETIVETRE
jgi:hypothetical protein